MGYTILAHFAPGRSILISIFAMIAIGTLGLAHPASRLIPMSWLDLFFTATSATCVTGLFTIPIEQFTFLGKAIILLLIQIGGLGLITMTLFFMTLFIDLGLGTQLMAGQLLEIESKHNPKTMIIFIITISLIVELIGALCMFPVMYQTMPFSNALFASLFHSISSYCNAGITIFEGANHHIINHPIIILITMLLILIGGLGFLTWQELGNAIPDIFDKNPHRFSLHSKIVLFGSTTLICTSAIVFWIIEHQSLFANSSTFETIFNSLFHAISFRSAGLSLIPLEHLQTASLVLIMILGFIGSAPGSTGSGIKITTFIIFLATIRATLLGKSSVSIKGRRIPNDLVLRAVTIIGISSIWIIITTFCLLITEQSHNILELLFEVTSAYTNTGLSLGITPHLSNIGKLFIIMSMIVGRIGLISVILALKLKQLTEKREFSYPEERVMLG